MSVTITFHTLAEKQPLPFESIIWLKSIGSFGYEGFEPREIEADYLWELLDEDGTDAGQSACFDPETESQYKVGDIIEIEGQKWKLSILFDGWRVHEDALWISVEDYWKCFD